MGTTEHATSSETRSIKAIDTLSAHRITSGQVVIDLQTAVKELVENSLDAEATSIEVRFKDHGLDTIEVIDNGTGVAPADYDVVALKHHTSKLSTFEDLNSVSTFGFRGEALASLCSLSDSVTVTTATASTAPIGTILELDRLGRVSNRSGKVARQRGTTVTISGIFKPLPVRRKEFERNAKREFGKALNLLTAYALVPCTRENGGVRLTVSHQLSGRKSVQLRTDGSTSLRASISALWGPKTLENLVGLDLSFEVESEKSVLRRQNAGIGEISATKVVMRGMVSKFSLNCGRSASDRQFFFINGRPCNPTKVQKAFNEIYRTFNAAQVPFIVANFTLPNGSHDINVSPDKRTIFIHSEDNLVQALKAALEERFAPERSTYTVRPTQTQITTGSKESTSRDAAHEPRVIDKDDPSVSSTPAGFQPLFLRDDDEVEIVPPPPPLDIDVDMEESQLLVERNATESSGSARPPAPSASSFTKQRHTSPSGVLVDPVQPAGAPQVDASMSRHEERPALPTVTQMRDNWTDNPVRLQSGDDKPSLVRHTSPAEPSDPPPIPSLQSTVAHGSTSPVLRTSFNNVSRESKKDPTQLVLSTTGAAWSLRRTAGTEGLDRDAPRKRARFSHDGAPTGGTSTTPPTSKLHFRSRMASYALPSSQLAQRVSEAAGDNEDDQAMGEVDVDKGSEMVNHSQGSSQHDGTCSNSLEPGAADASSGCSADSPGLAASELSFIDPGMSGEKPPEIIKTAATDAVDMRFDLCETSSRWRRWRDSFVVARTVDGRVAPGSSRAREAGIDSAESDGLKAEEALSRVIAKDDFSSMEVLGQFNLGFIIVRRRKSCTELANTSARSCPMDDLFIVDQHAADEKYNFETLQQTTKINSQALIRPKLLELTASDELLALENMNILRQNGFEIGAEEDSEDQLDSRRRLRLVAQPVSKSTVFDIRDLEELLHLLRDRPQGQMVRCSKARAMFASRACRKSVMVGMPLKAQQMTAIVRHMGTMDQPWNCPHGRPTMRHLSDISNLGRDHLSDKRLDWQAFTQD